MLVSDSGRDDDAIRILFSPHSPGVARRVCQENLSLQSILHEVSVFIAMIMNTFYILTVRCGPVFKAQVLDDELQMPNIGQFWDVDL